MALRCESRQPDLIDTKVLGFIKMTSLAKLLKCIKVKSLGVQLYGFEYKVYILNSAFFGTWSCITLPPFFVTLCRTILKAWNKLNTSSGESEVASFRTIIRNITLSYIKKGKKAEGGGGNPVPLGHEPNGHELKIIFLLFHRMWVEINMLSLIPLKVLILFLCIYLMYLELHLRLNIVI